MRCCILLLSCFILCSCGSGYQNHEAIDAVNSSVVALEKLLSKECKTEGINAQITAIKKEMASIEKDCTASIKMADSERVKWKTAFFGLLLVIGVFGLRKVL